MGPKFRISSWNVEWYQKVQVVPLRNRSLATSTGFGTFPVNLLHQKVAATIRVLVQRSAAFILN